MQWKIAAGAVFTGILLLFYAFGAYGDDGFYFLPSMIIVVLYGWVSRDFKLSAIFGFLFFLAFPCAIILRYHDVPPPAALPYLLLWGLVTVLMGVISVWVGRKMPSE